ncbi:MAG: POTRA domain-containing protein [candidate division WOR-3 bacterium]
MFLHHPHCPLPTVRALPCLLGALALGSILTGAEPASGQISRIKFTGWHPPAKFSLNLAAGDPLDEKSIVAAQRIIQNYLLDQGYLNATVDPEISATPDGVILNFQVQTGTRARLAGWLFTGNESFTARELSRLTGSRARPFTRNELNRVLAALQRFYENNGFPLVEIQFTGLQETALGVKPILKIDEGPQIKISFLCFTPGSRLNQLLLSRTAGFTKPLIYQPARIARWQFNLKNTGWLTIDSLDLVHQDSLYGLRFYITPRKTGELAAVLGYSPATSRFIGWADISLFNIFNTGRTACIGWRSLSHQTEYQLGYTEPFPFHLPLSLTAALNHRVYDTSYAFTSGAITATVGYEPLRLNLNLGFNRLAGNNRKNSVWAGTGLSIDNRTDIGNFSPGMFFQLTTRGGRQSTPDRSTGLIGWLESDWSTLVPITGRFAWGNTVSLRAVYSQLPLAEPELYPVGGLDNVRGYHEGTFLSDRFAWWNCEPRYYLSTGSRLHLFFDTGLFRTGSADPTLIAGYGFGGRWQTRIGVLGIDFGIPVVESLLHAKIHLNFRTGF